MVPQTGEPASWATRFLCRPGATQGPVPQGGPGSHPKELTPIPGPRVGRLQKPWTKTPPSSWEGQGLSSQISRAPSRPTSGLFFACWDGAKASTKPGQPSLRASRPKSFPRVRSCTKPRAAAFDPARVCSDHAVTAADSQKHTVPDWFSFKMAWELHAMWEPNLEPGAVRCAHAAWRHS